MHRNHMTELRNAAGQSEADLVVDVNSEMTDESSPIGRASCDAMRVAEIRLCGVSHRNYVVYHMFARRG